ncbi:phage tail protein [Paenarthrobacter sp. YAF11_1]|jgi:phage tail-like protein|uniref:phage tail protein n=1 Tax=Micrococcaceae TaxID=1268 RepID=UPI0013570677|nr:MULTISPECIES: phage tail protein [unclassified Arthrobacter]MDR6686783.1 phage tail-like protein [Arthrobacter sp. 1088]BCW08128.1 phage tail protein [Arthrobacter sp. NtRootA1]BCW47075.1 phage tail protein [Arthrobacter sp. StoSoilB5]
MTTPTPAAQPGNVVDPYRAYNFKLVIQGVVQGHFTKVEGLGLKIDRILYRSGGENSTVRVIPGQVEYTPVTLKYGLTDSTEMLQWLFKAVDGKVERRNVSIAMLNDAGSVEVRRWNLLGAWPCDWFGAPLDALGKDLAIESLSIAYDRLELDDARAPVA